MKQKVRKVDKLLANASKAVEKFKKQSNLSCISNCGNCCFTNKVEATVLEFLPLAEFLWNNQLAESSLEKLEKSHQEGPCLFYKPEVADPSMGRCSMYEYRGLICRLFGFSIRINKRGVPELIACKRIKDSQNKLIDLQRILNNKYSKPLMGLYYLKLSDIDYLLSKTMFPINKAIQEAILIYGFSSTFQSEDYFKNS